MTGQENVIFSIQVTACLTIYQVIKPTIHKDIKENMWPEDYKSIFKTF
jgi:hypothetical protein